MIRLMDELPDRVVGIVASGEVTHEDYRDTLIPALIAAIERHGKVRVLYVVGEELEGFSLEALWDDAQLGLTKLGAFERVAVVSDRHWITGTTAAFAPLMPFEVRAFAESELEEAKDWICEGPKPAPAAA